MDNFKKIYPVFEENFVSVVSQSSNKYVLYLSVVLESLVQNSSKNINYDLVVFEKDILELEKIY
ncbi:hypothetical protein V2I21_03310 [Campylobacter sp. CLAX-22107-21]|uniref:hypothetical protein n=1 Tax=Campylobacter devanensis TaxID=3161138 RepID=UPI000A34A526|nr:hypothetical protein [Campylobacter sp. P148]MEE3694150.1 hypothetical protein [Campylobacter sp. CLAX-22107-21]